MPVLELKNIRKSYFLGKEEFPVLKGIDLEFERGDFVSLLGESGGGKSTLMNIIGGLDRKYDGDVVVDGVAQKSKKEKDMDAYRRDTIGFIFQSFNLVNYLSVLDNILISLKMTTLSEKERQARAIELTKQVGLYDHRKKKPNQLSGGQKQRVAIARALASDPEIILADEPTGALDSQNTKEVLAILRDIAQSGKTVIVVTHSQEVADYGTRIIHLADGQITGDERIKPAYPVEEKAKPFATKALSYVDIIRTGFKHFLNAWKINLLIAIGTAIGLFSVIFFLGLGVGGTHYMNKTIDGAFPINTNAPVVVKRPSSVSAKTPDTQAFGQAQQQQAQGDTSLLMNSSDLDKLKGLDNVTKIEGMYNINVLHGSVTQDAKSTTMQSLGSWSNYNLKSSIKSGKVPTGDKITLSEDLAKKFNSNTKALVGKTIALSFIIMGENNAPTTITGNYTVSGIVKSSSQLNDIYFTSSALKSLLSSHNISTNYQLAVLTVNRVSNVQDVSKAVRKIKVDGRQYFSSMDMGSVLSMFTNITSIVSYVLAAIAGVGLVVSIFMIIVTTYMSVAERTKEIGIMRALGGRRKDVSRLFTTESLILGVFAAAIALGFSFAMSAIVNSVLSSFLGGVAIIQITPVIIIFAILISLLIAFLSSLAPSARAARLNTIEALAAE
ncbi:ATP-binding cassette domain-containing protein [Lactococcus nasutitermitis]|uniref:ATP-binding cassette domain-containing protein n=1 Tax=Lactococcus nasutitermitis TaxID=1652957 RepID=A0ABV9JDE8_9LACT|nr:ABC transporter ATP-binding protein/permease [Lactococcus nasutitermitis]